MYKVCLLLLIIPFNAYADTCQDWFKKLNIKPGKNCEAQCRVSQSDMSSYMCPQECEFLCQVPKDTDINENLYGLTDDEIKFCKENTVNCAKAYLLSWDAEKICLTIYPKSRVNDESDACRHYIWAILLSRDIDSSTAETVTSAHENTPHEKQDEKAMDLANNRLGLFYYQNLKNKKTTDEQIAQSFKEQLASKKFIILRPKYSKTGGTP